MRVNTQINVGQLAPNRKSPPTQPAAVLPTIMIKKLIQLNVPLSEDTGVATVAFGALSAGLPGGATYWDRLRVDYVYVYGDQRPVSDSGANSINVTVAASGAWNQPNFQLSDVGTEGNVRPRVGFSLGLLDKARWFTPASTELLCTISGVPGTTALLQASIHVVSPALAVV